MGISGSTSRRTRTRRRTRKRMIGRTRALTAIVRPNAIQACTRRNRSNTPLQALTLLNDRAFVEFAGALAGRVVREGGPSDASRTDFAFRLSTYLTLALACAGLGYAEWDFLPIVSPRSAD